MAGDAEELERARLDAANYDDVADEYGDAFIDSVGEALVDLLNPLPGVRVLDAGAGRGAVTRALIARGADVWAIDVSKRMVEHLRQSVPSADLAIGDAALTKHPDAFFDAVTAGYLLTVTPGRGAAMLEEWRRILKRGGTLAVSEPGPIHPDWFWMHNIASQYFPRPTAEQHNARQDAEVRQVLRDAEDTGFAVRHSTTMRSPVMFDDTTDAYTFLLDSGLRAAIQQLPAVGAADFSHQIRSGLTRMLEIDGCIAVDQTARLFLFDR